MQVALDLASGLLEIALNLLHPPLAPKILLASNFPYCLPNLAAGPIQHPTHLVG
jgi:hypothetical protein